MSRPGSWHRPLSFFGSSSGRCALSRQNANSGWASKTRSTASCQPAVMHPPHGSSEKIMNSCFHTFLRGGSDVRCRDITLLVIASRLSRAASAAREGTRKTRIAAHPGSPHQLARARGRRPRTFRQSNRNVDCDNARRSAQRTSANRGKMRRRTSLPVRRAKATSQPPGHPSTPATHVSSDALSSEALPAMP